MKFEPLLIGKVSEHVERKIKEAIFDGKLTPGKKLPSERAMAEQFGVSLGSVREALKALQVLGLVEKKQGRSGGIFVSEINNRAVKKSLGYYLEFKDLSFKHIDEVRNVIEPQIIKMAIENITPEVVKKLEENLLSCEEKAKRIGTNLTKREFSDLDRTNLEFHKIIVGITNNPILVLIFDYICDLITGLREKYIKPDIKFIIDTIGEHRRLLECIKQNNAERCTEEIISHLKQLDISLRGVEKWPISAVSRYEKEN